MNSNNVTFLQNFLNNHGANPKLKTDGIYGAITRHALDIFLNGSDVTGWEFITNYMELAGTDVIYRRQNVTWFGGSNDPQDNGETASGVITKGNPNIIGCSLAMDFGDKVPNTKFAPMQKVPWFTRVEFTANGKTINVPLIDIGPAKYTKNGGDLTQKSFKMLSPSGTTREGVIKNVTIRIIGGTKYANHARPT